MTSDGSAHARFRRAILTGNPMLVDAAARELSHISLEDALRILLVFAEAGDRRFDRAAARLAARVTSERRLTLAEARYVLALAEAVPSSPSAVAALLKPFCIADR
jgi:hypothetical protein